MKHKSLFPRPIPVLASLLLTMLCAIGCTQEDPSEFPGSAPNDSDEPIPVTIAFNGVETMFGPYGAETRNLQANKIHFSQEYDKTRMIETIVMAEPDTLQVPLDPSTRGSLASTTLRIVAYDAANKVYQGTGVFDIDENGIVSPSSKETLSLKPGQYTFHSFSPAEKIVVSEDKTTVTVTLPTVKGIEDPKSYYAKTDKPVTVALPTSAGTCPVTIPILKPQYCKLTLNVSALEGKTISYESAALTTTLYKEASLALPGGTVSSANSSREPTTFGSESHTIYTYPGATSALSITLHNVTVNGKSQTVEPITSSIGLSMKAGYAYNMEVKFEKKNWIKVDALTFKVAMGNLRGPVIGDEPNQNRDGLPVGDWTIGSDQGWYSGEWKSGDYFNWGVRDPLCAGGSKQEYYVADMTKCPWGPIYGLNATYYSRNTEENPCWLALGDGWHVPTDQEMTTITRAKFKVGKYKSLSLGQAVQGVYVGTNETVEEKDQDKYVFFPCVGRRGAGDYYSVKDKDKEGTFWTTTPHNQQEYRGYQMIVQKDGLRIASDSKYYGASIRCVSY